MKNNFVKVLAVAFTILAAATGVATGQTVTPLQKGYDEGAKAGNKQSARFTPRVRPIATHSPKTADVQTTGTRRSAKPQQAASTTGYVPTIYGTVLYDNTWTAATKARGVYSFPASAQNFSMNAEVTDNNIFNATSGYGTDGFYHFIGSKESSNCYFQYDTENWTEIKESEIWSKVYLGVDMTYDPTTQKVYGAFPNSSYGADHLEFGTIDFSRSYGLTDIISSLDTITVVAMAANTQGEIYMISKAGNLFNINKSTGIYTLIGNTGVLPSDYLQSATFDPKTGHLYWACTLADETAALYDVDIATGRATQVLKFPHDQEIVGLYIPMPAADDNAPAAVTGLTANFVNGQLTGNVVFTMPVATFGGGKLNSGDLQYAVMCGDETLTTGSASAGQQVSATVTLPSGGTTKLKVMAKNAQGFGPAARVSFWAGFDQPLAPTNATFNLLGDKALLSWSAVSQSVHGGLLDGKVTYNVVRHPDGTTVASGIEGTTFTDQLHKGEMKNIYYTVTAKAGKEESEPVQTNSQVWGDAFQLPYEDDLTTTNDHLAFYTVVDANNDGSKWMNYYGRICYKYDDNNAADDWLVLPPVKLEGGKDYLVTFCCHAGYSGTEKLAVAYGLSTSTIDQYDQIVAPTEITGTDVTEHQQRFTPKASGDYNIGFHALSDPDQYYLYLDRVRIEEAPSLEVPDTVKSLAVTPAPQGRLSAAVSFTAPVKTESGNTLETITKAEIMRGDDIVATLDDVTPGKTVSYTDNAPLNGYNTYSVVCYNSEGKGKAAKTTAWVGFDAPKGPSDVKVKDLGDNVQISWTAPDTSVKGVHGGYVNPASVRYSLNDPTAGMIIVAEHVDGTSLLDTKVHTSVSDSQAMLYYSVTSEAMAADGTYVEGGGVSSPYMRTGKAAALPFRESLPGGVSEADYCWSENNRMSTWGQTSDLSADNDKGALVFTSSTENDWSIWHAPKLSLADARQPYFMLYYYVMEDNDVTLSIEAMDNSYEPSVLKTIDFKKDNLKAGWHRVAVPLAQYADKLYVIPGVKATVAGKGNYAVIDDIEVRDVFDNDLKATIAAQSQANVGGQGKVVVNVSNEGVKTAQDYTVSLYRNGTLVETKEGPAVEFTETTEVDFNFTPSVNDQSIKWKAVVNYAADQSTDNNTTAEVTTTVRQNNYPTAQGVKAETDGGTVNVTWNAIADGMGSTTTESFEDYDAWTQNAIGDWTTIDGDGGFTYQMGQDLPFKGAGYPMAWMVMNPTGWELDINDFARLAPHSGNQYLVAFDTYGNEEDGISQSDDWLISPEISGKRQTISFFAKSLDSSYKETFKVAYSTGSTDKADFVTLKTVSEAASVWTKYTVELPEGAKRFAIVNVSKKQFALMLDDVTYEGVALKVDHFNIYRDGQKIGTAPAGATSFADKSVTGGEHSYKVSVQYESGESPLSSAAVVTVTTGIGSITVDGAVAHKIYTIGGAACEADADKLPAGIYVIDGKKVMKK